MSMSQSETSFLSGPTGQRCNGAPSLPAATLDLLSARFRPAGFCLVILRPDGSIIYHDPASAGFFHRYVIPLMQNPEPQGFNKVLSGLTASSPVTASDLLPGVVLAVFPYVERRQLTGVVILAAKSQRFELTEEILNIGNRLGLDSAALNQLSKELPGIAEDLVQRQAQMLVAMIRDQLKLAGLDQELTSLSGQLANTYEELSLIYQISGGMRINRRPVDFFKQACLDAIEVMGIRGMGVALQAAKQLGQEPVIYGPLTLAPEKVVRLATGLLSWMGQRKTSLLINDLSKNKQFSWLGEDARRLLAVPLQRGEEILGCLFALEKELGDFDSVDSKLLNSIANESAIYLENAMLFEDVHGLMMGLLRSLTSAVDAKDPYTCGHSERVAMLSKLLAQAAGLTENEVDRIYMAGLLHDVGKIGVPESVLHKPGRLTAEEFDQMKKHPTIGARILQDVKQIQDIIPGVMHHHERYDGKGYPAGLAGQNIPLMGRIICLADCFDAMTSTRTYRKALPLEAALADIRRCSGTQFDPSLTESFLRIEMDQLREVLRHMEASNRLDLRAPGVSAQSAISSVPAVHVKAA
jgi:putative nucleotidyltransferase with HDIG domain